MDPVQGVGIGWRPEIEATVADLPGLRWCEVVAESVDPQAPPPDLRYLMDRGVAVVPHGVRLSLGSADGVDPDRVRRFAEVVDAVDAPLASEHISFVRAGDLDIGHLTPLPRSREAVDVMVRNVRAVTSELSVPFALEPIAALFEWPDAELSESQFITEILERTDCHLLLDVANVYANAFNAGTEPAALFDELPLDRIAYCHIAGGAELDGLYHDTHTDTTPPEVMDLLTDLARRHQPPAVMLERDGHYPPPAELMTELDRIADASGHARVTPAAA